MALIESAESSNRIEGVTVEKNCLCPLILGNTRPRDRSEEEIIGYRMSLNCIHTNHNKIPITPETCLRLHALAQGGSSGDAGKWKTKPVDIIETFPDGHRKTRFTTLAPELVPKPMEELCLAYRHAIDQLKVTPLLASSGWNEGKHDVMPWFNYFLSTWRRAYREFEERASRKRPLRGSKTDQVEYALQSIISPFGIADVERLCPNISRDMIRLVMNRWREEGQLEMLGK